MTSANTHGFPCAARPTITRAQPVSSSMRLRVRARAHVAVAKYRNVHGAHDLGDHPPIGMSGIELVARAGVDGHGARALALADAGHLGGIDAWTHPSRRGSSPSPAVSSRARRRARLRPAAFGSRIRALPSPLPTIFGAGQPKLRSIKAKPSPSSSLRGEANVFRFAAKELQTGSALAGEARQKFHGVAVFPPGEHPALGREHLAHRPRRALLKAEQRAWPRR